MSKKILKNDKSPLIDNIIRNGCPVRPFMCRLPDNNLNPVMFYLKPKSNEKNVCIDDSAGCKLRYS